MLGIRSAQTDLFSADQHFLKDVGENSFYGFLARHRDELFTDDQFADLYCSDNGRRSTPPSLLAVALLLQAYTAVSDAEAIERMRFDLRWQVALGTPVGSAVCVKSTLQLFRAQLVLHNRPQAIFETVLKAARIRGFFKGRSSVALDTSPLRGRGAVEDTFNLLSKGARRVLVTLAQQEHRTLRALAAEYGFDRFAAASFKGTLEIDWDDQQQRKAVLTVLVSDCDRVMELAATRLTGLDPESKEAIKLIEATDLLATLLAQDIRRKAAQLDGPEDIELVDGVARDRVISAHDPEMRHGRKSSAQRFDGHKTSIAVEPESGLITAVDVIAGNAHDGSNAQSMIDRTEIATGERVKVVLGDGAFGTVESRIQAVKNDREILAPVPKTGTKGRFSKNDFQVDLDTGVVRCPAGQQTTRWTPRRIKNDSGSEFAGRTYQFSVAQCSECPLRSQCIADTTRQRTISVHEHEAILQQARADQQTSEYRQRYRKRVAVEHAFAHLMQRGLRQARYFGRAKSLFQAAMAAAAVNVMKLIARVDTFGAVSAPDPTLAAHILAILTYRRPIRRFRPWRSQHFSSAAWV